MVVWYASLITLIGAVAAAIIMVYFASRHHPQQPTNKVVSDLYNIRAGYCYILLTILIVLLFFTWTFRPYYHKHKAVPVLSVSVIGRMWSWSITGIKDPNKLLKKNTQGEWIFPVGKPVEFRVTSDDVNHGFGIYNAYGELLAQTQAMPNYINRLIYTFNKPGEYSALCMEYCGLAHHMMFTKFKVE